MSVETLGNRRVVIKCGGYLEDFFAASNAIPSKNTDRSARAASRDFCSKQATFAICRPAVLHFLDQLHKPVCSIGAQPAVTVTVVALQGNIG